MLQNMKQRVLPFMALLGTAGTALVLLLRLVLTPHLRDEATGLFSANVAAIIAAGIVLAVLAVLAVFARNQQGVFSPRPMPMALALLLCGAVLAMDGLWGAVEWIGYGVLPTADAAGATVGRVLAVLQLLCSAGGGVVLVLLGLQIAARGGLKKGMGMLGVLLPVLWAWFRLAGYEMSYSSAINPGSVFFVFLMFIFELVFLFQFARLVSGIGKVRPAVLMLCAMGVAIFALGGYLFWLGMMLFGEGEAAQTSFVSMADGALGVLGLVVGWSLLSLKAPEPEGETPSEAETEEPSNQA